MGWPLLSNTRPTPSEAQKTRNKETPKHRHGQGKSSILKVSESALQFLGQRTWLPTLQWECLTTTHLPGPPTLQWECLTTTHLISQALTWSRCRRLRSSSCWSCSCLILSNSRSWALRRRSSSPVRCPRRSARCFLSWKDHGVTRGDLQWLLTPQNQSPQLLLYQVSELTEGHYQLPKAAFRGGPQRQQSPRPRMPACSPCGA